MHNICVDIKHSKTNGFLWHERQKSNENTIFEKRRLCHNGLLLRVNPVAATDTSKFTQAAFGGSFGQFVACDQLGKLFLFEIQSNRYRLITHLPSQPRCIIWNGYHPSKVLTSLEDCSLCYIDIISRKCEKLAGHSTPALYVDIHPHGNRAVSNSNHEAIIWDLQSCTQIQKLNITHETELIEAFFSGLDIFITCFKDNSIFIWDIKTCQCRTHLKPQCTKFGQYKTFAASINGFNLIAAGISSELHMWDLNLGTISKVIQLPSSIKGTKNIYLLDNWASNSFEVVALLSTDNFLYLINIATASVILRMAGHDSPLKKIAISSSCTFMVTVLESGCLDLYDLKVLIPGKDAKIVKISMPIVKEKSASDVYPVPIRSQAVDYSDERMLAGMDRRTEIVDEQAEIKLDSSKLQSLLDNYGEYPERYRSLIWNFLLELPGNKGSYFALERNGVHYLFNKLDEKFPLGNEKLMERLKSILSCLAFWSPLFGYVEYIPLFCFPFVKSISKNIQCFETVATILVNWCGNWFEFFPCPPVSILKSVQTLLIHHDYHLNQHFTKRQIEPEIYAWPILETAFSEIFSKNDWMRLWDHLVSNHPSFIISICAAYSIVARQSLMSCLNLEDFKFFYHHQNPVSLKSVLKEGYRIQKQTPNDIHPRQIVPDFRPLTRETYPVFNKYPNFVVEHKISEQELFRKNEEEYQQLQKSARKLDEKLQSLDEEEKICQQKLDSFKEIGGRRKQFLKKEEEEFALRRNRLLSLKRDMQLKELCILKSLRNKFSKEQQLKWQFEIQELEYKIEAKMKQHEQEISKAMAEVKDFQTFLVSEKQNLELEVQKLLSGEETRQHSQINFTNRPVENAGLEKQYEKQQNCGMKSVRADRNEYTTKTQLSRDSATTDAKVVDYMQQLTSLQRKNQTLEQEIENLTKNVIFYKQRADERPQRDESLRAGVDVLQNRNAFTDAFSVRQKLAYNMRTRYS